MAKSLWHMSLLESRRSCSLGGRLIRDVGAPADQQRSGVPPGMHPWALRRHSLKPWANQIGRISRLVARTDGTGQMSYLVHDAGGRLIGAEYAGVQPLYFALQGKQGGPGPR